MSTPRDLVIGVDSSTTACKAIAWTREGKPVAESRASHDMFSPQPNWYEQRAEDWWDALCSVLRGVTEQVGKDRVAAISISKKRETFVLVDEECQSISNAIVWLDNRATKEVLELDEIVGNDRIHEITGKGPSTTQGLPTFVWLRKNEPQLMNRAYKILDPHAYLINRLTGQWKTSLASADPMGVVDMRAGTWAVDLLNTLELSPDKFVEIVPSGSVVGELSDRAAQSTGLMKDTLIVAGAGDGQSAGLGANITRPGVAYLNLGTAMVSGAYAEDYVWDKAFRTLSSPVAGAFVPEEVLAAGTFTVSWFVNYFAPNIDALNLPLSAEEVLEVAAKKLPPGSLGLMLVPYWGGVMPPYWNAEATGITVGWTGAHRREHFYRAILEGIAYEHRLTMDGVGKATGVPIDEYILMGGGSRSDLWCQIVADMNGKSVTRASTAEATNLGAAILAAAAVGWYDDVRAAADAMTSTTDRFEPDDATHKIYDRLFNEVYKGLYPAIGEYLTRLTTITRGQVDER